MKKVLLITLIIIIVPFIVVNFFIRDEEIQFKYVSNMKVRVKRTSSGTIEEVPLEEYVTGVLAGEMPISFQLEALKAQAVAARSYVMKKMEYNQKKDYDVVDTIANQVFLDDEQLQKAWKDNYTENINKIKTAVIETKGLYLEYGGKVAEAFFFSTSVGSTENSEEVFQQALPYLRSVPSEWDAKVSPVYNDKVVLTLEQFYLKLNLKWKENITVEVLSTTSTGRIKKIKINGVTFTGGEVCAYLNLRSTFFKINQNGNTVTVNTKGYGHGVGMSQYGAEGMAQEGYKYDEILKHYYQGINIKKI